ncbi:DHH family phosphoesterase [Paenibacillus sp. FSL M7-0802]|uniref:DHH family phosphoesterase n=1 Tax=Paenibacillus sp. FSL M7-0802 TaxID=2921536 RepID=UPI0030F6EED0
MLKNIDALVSRIIKAIKNNEKIIIYADVDYDGITSAVILYKWLINFTNNVFIKHVERSVGHGSEYIVDKVEDDTDLYIAVDSSSNDVEPLKMLVDKGIDCLVIDHHTVDVYNPYCILVNPQQPECKYPNKNASGGLLVFKVCQVLDDYMDTSFTLELSDLPGFALMADMMSMMEMENRYYAKLSLKGLRHEGLKLLFESMNSDLKTLTSTDFLYGASPAVTAATRADNMKLAIDFLMSDTISSDTKKYVKELIKLNENRKIVQSEALEAMKTGLCESDKVIIVFDPTLGRGINGLVAQEISKKYSRPAIVLGFGDDKDTYSGSFRGLDDFSMLELLSRCENTTYAAGHDGAGGVGVLVTHLELLRQELNSKLRDFVPDNTIYYDLEFNANDVDERLINHLTEFYRYSGNNFKPGTFLIKDLFISDKKLMGKANNTVKIDCGKLQLMKFKTGEEYYEKVPVFTEIEALGSLNVNIWTQYRPKKKVIKTCQLFIEDYKEVNQTK